MDVKQYENIKAKIEALKTKRAKAEGSMETILANWKSAHGISTIEEAEALEKEMSSQVEKAQEEIDELYTELKGLTNWGLV
jgi:DNA repair exonuclease SbcCD ATPase subunit